MNIFVKSNAATAAGNALNSCSGPHVNHRTLTKKDGGHLIMTDNSPCAPAPLSGICFAKKASTNQTAEGSKRPVFKDAMSLPSALRKNMEATLKQLTSQEFESIWWEEGSCSFSVPRGTSEEQRQWQERLQAAAQQAFDSNPDSSNGSEATFEFNILRKTRVHLLLRFLEDLPLLTAQWGRVAADASWYDKMVADSVSCAWLGNILISDWLPCVAICTDVVTDAVFRETWAIRRERVLAPVLVSTPVFQVPQELQCQKLAVLTQRANRAAGMQMIAHSRKAARKTGLAPIVGSGAVVLLNDVNLLLGPLCVLRHATPLHSSYHVAADIKILCNSTVLVQTNIGLNLYLRPGTIAYSHSPPGSLHMLELPQAAREPVVHTARTLSLTAAVCAIRTMLRRGLKKFSIVAILSKSVSITVVGIVVSGAIVYALLHCCGSRLEGIPAVKLVLQAPWGAVAVILLHINMACHMAAKLARGAGLRLQSVRQLLMQQAAIPPLFHLGIVEPPEKRTRPTSGRIINLTAHAGALPAAEFAGTSQSLLALPARAATWGAKHAAQAAVVAAGGLRDAAAMSIMAAEETVRIASKPVEAIIGHKVAQAADFDGYPLPACPASVGTFRAGVRMGYQVAGALSAIPKGLFRGAVRLFSS